MTMNEYGTVGAYGALGGSALQNGQPALANGWLDFLAPKKSAAADKPVLSNGSGTYMGTDPESEAVMELQGLLGTKVDGSFRGGTEASVKSYQLSKGLKATGVVDAGTWTVLLRGGVPLSDEEKAEKQAKTAATIASAGSAITSLFSAFGPQEMLSQPVPYEEPEPEGLPWGWIIGGVAVVGFLGFGVYMMTAAKD